MGRATIEILRVLAMVVLVFLLLQATPVSNSEAAKILEESYQISRTLKDQNRAFALVRLTDISTNVSPSRTIAWSKELLTLAPSMPANWNRTAAERNALIPLARVEPVQAFELLSKIEMPIPQSDGFPEDIRDNAAEVIFVNYFHAAGLAQLDGIVRAADAIGETGEYPYRAMGLIIEELTKSPAKPEVATHIFHRALTYFHRGSIFQDEDVEFFDLLERVQFMIPVEEYKNGLKEFVRHLTTVRSNEISKYAARALTAFGVVEFDSEKKLLLFRIFPTLAGTDARWARELVNQYPWLSQAGEDIDIIAASAVPETSSHLNTSAVNALVAENLILRKIQHLQNTNPIAALAEARSLTDSSARARTLSLILPILARFDRAQARSVYDELQVLVTKVPAGMSRLRIMIDVAEAAYYVNDFNGFAGYMDQVFDYGMQLFQAQGADIVTLQHQGTLELMNMAEFAGEHVGMRVLPRIRSIQDNGLRAFLLLSTAKGMGRAESNQDATVSSQ